MPPEDRPQPSREEVDRLDSVDQVGTEAGRLREDVRPGASDDPPAQSRGIQQHDSRL